MKKRAVIEETYSKSLAKLSSGLHGNAQESISDNGNKASYVLKPGTFSSHWQGILTLSEQNAKEHGVFSRKLHDIADSLQGHVQDIDRSRREFKESGMKNYRILIESKHAYDKVGIPDDYLCTINQHATME